MISYPNVNSVRNIIGGLFLGYGIASFICFSVLDHMWMSAAPSHPDLARGLIFKHNDHRIHVYFSLFQVTAEWLMLRTSVPLALVGMLLAPRKFLPAAGRWSPKMERDDPRSVGKWTAIASATMTPFFLFFIGPQIVQDLVSTGLIPNPA